MRTTMLNRLIFLLACLLPLWANGQILLQDNFSDGDLLNPNWLGDVDNFIVNSEQMLQLNAPEAGNSTISLVAQTVSDQSVSFEFLVQFPFALSASNYAAIELSGRHANGDAAFYQLRIGGISGNDDALVFSTSSTDVIAIPLINGIVGALGGTSINSRIRLSRGIDNIWTLEADHSGGNNFQLEGSAQDLVIEPAALQKFSLTCIYTATRTTAFSFDDFLVGPVTPDTMAPFIDQAFIEGPSSIRLIFSEPVLSNPIDQLANYQFNIASPQLSSVMASEGSVRLNFDGPLPAGVEMEVSVNQIIDCSGNEATDLIASFFITPTVVPSSDNLIITEFMADPTPVVGLPEAEYVEIFNRGTTTIALDGLQIATASTTRPVVPFSLEPGQYAIILRPEDINSFPTDLRLGITPSMPTLVNGSGTIRLLFNGQLIQELNYNPSWFDDPSKADGGYSLELSDPYTNDFNCAGLWAASRDPRGGTPGQQNSVIGLAIDTLGPSILAAGFLQSSIEISFSEQLAESVTVEAFSLSPDLGILQLNATSDPNTYQLEISNLPSSGQVYTLSLSDEVSDCAGNTLAGSSSVQLGLAEIASPGDVVINEILFNPYTAGVDFVEVFNCSDKILRINGWNLLNESSTSSNNRQVVNSNTLLLPGGFLVFTPDEENILRNYPDQAQRQFLVRNTLPSLPDDAGNLTILNQNAEELDRFDYTEDMHSGLLSDLNGVSLERINTKAATQQAGNWFSAASQVGYATPTRPNSQTRNLPSDTENFFFLEDNILSPDGDGFQDALLIYYNTPSAGWNARLRILDANGRLVKILRPSDLLAGSGTLIWDGSRDDGQRARTGAYVILVERFHPDGSTANEKLVVVVAN